MSLNKIHSKLSSISQESLTLIYSEELSSLERYIADRLDPLDALSFVASGVVHTNGDESLKKTRRHLRYEYIQEIIVGYGKNKTNPINKILRPNKFSLWNDENLKNGLPNRLVSINAIIFALFSFIFILLSLNLFSFYKIDLKFFEAVLLFLPVFSSAFVSYLFSWRVNSYLIKKTVPKDSGIKPHLTTIFTPRLFLGVAVTNPYFNGTLTVDGIASEYSAHLPIPNAYKQIDDDNCTFLEHLKYRIDPDPDNPYSLVHDLIERKTKDKTGIQTMQDIHIKMDKFNDFMDTDHGLSFSVYLNKSKLSKKVMDGENTSKDSTFVPPIAL